MKTNILKNIRVWAILMVCLTIGVGDAWATDATFTISSYSGSSSPYTISGTLANAPTGATASCQSTYGNAYQMTEGKIQTLTLSGFDGCTITGVKVHVKTNAKSGNGSGTLTINGTSKGSLSNTGTIGSSYTDKSFSVTSTVVSTGQTVVITLTAGANSFYCDKYTVTYTAPADPYTVLFNTGTGNPSIESRTEASGGAGITLPSTSDLTPSCSGDGWVLYGWATSAYGSSSTTTAPTTTLAGLAGAKYYPTSNTTLYAVYRKAEGLAGTTMWSEDFTGESADAQPTSPTTGGGSVYGSASVTYTCQTSYTKIYANANAGGTSPEILVPQSSRSGYFSATGIPTGGETSFTLTYKTNQSGLVVASSTSGVTVGNATGTNPYTRTITTNSSSISSFILTFSMSTSSNARLDDISLVVNGTCYYWSAPTCTVSHSVSSAVEPTGKATVTLGATSVEEGSTTTASCGSFTAGYEFVDWSISGTGASLSSTTSNPTTITMGTADVTVTANLRCITPTFSAHPSNVTCNQGASPSLSVTAAAGGASLSYQWMQCATADGVYSNVASGGTSSTYSPSTASLGTMYYKCKVTNAASGCSTNATSNAALVTVKGAVTYDANGGTGTMTDASSPYASGSTVTVKSNTFTAPAGKQFDHWDTSDDDTGTDYDPGDTFTMSGNTTLYAQWVAAAACDDPNAPTASSVSGTGATISTSSSSADYDIYYSTSSTTPTTEDPSATISSGQSKAITGLSYGTTYYYWMRQNCGGGSISDWVAGSPTTFTTTVPAPTGLSMTPSLYGVTFSITDANNVNNYEIYYSTTNSAPETSPSGTATTTSKSKAVTGLPASTTYYCWVRAKGPNANSSWYSAGSFATLTLSSISVSTAPTKTKYLVGDYFDPTGLVITRSYSNSTSDTYTYADHNGEFTFSPATNAALTAENSSVTITYGGQTTSQAINVYSVTVNKVNMSGTAISNASVTASCSGRTLSQSVSTTNYLFNSWNVTAGGVSVSTNTITGTPTGDVTINAKFHDPITVTWKVGASAASGSPTTEVKYGTKISALPSTPADNAVASCGDANKFMGWTAAGKIEGTGHSAPADLFTTAGDATELTANTTYRAVFATQSGGGSSSEELTGSEITTNITNTACAYDTPKEHTDGVIGYTFNVYTDAASRPWVQLKAADPAAIKIEAPYNISRVDLTITSTANEKGGITDITKHTDFASDGTISLRTTSRTGTVVASNTGDNVSDDVLSITVASPANTTLYLTASTGCRIWGITVYYSTPLTISNYITGCCTQLDDLNGAVNWSNATTAVVSWDDIAHVDSWTVKYKTHDAGEWSTAGASSASAGTRSVTISSLTPCVDYDFQIIATPDEDYCNKDQTINDSQTHAYTVDYSGCSNVTKTAGGTTACGSSNLVATFTASLPYELPESVSVTIGGAAQTQGTNFTWSVSAGVGTLTISSAKQTGNIVIDVDGNLLTCDNDPTIGTAKLDGSGTFSLSSVSVSVTGCSVEGVVCEWEDYGFVWGTSANPAGNKTQIGTDGTATSWSGSLTGSFSTGVTYYYRAYGKNSKDGAEIVYGSDATFIPRSVTFNANGGSDVATKYVASGGTVSAPSAPAKTGYTFGGWYTDNGTWESAVNWSSTISANVTYYAKWNAITYSISYEGLEGASNSNPTSYNIETSTITLVDPGTRTGYTFAGWTLGGSPITQIAVGSTGDKTITATWTINQYNIAVAEVDGVTITATPAGGSTLAEGANANVDYNKTVTLAKEGLGTGIYWVGWKVTNAGGDDVTASVVSENTLTVPAYAVTVTAVLGKMKAWCMPEFEITGDVHLTSVKGVYVNTTSTTGDLLTLSGTNTENVTKISIDYLDNNGDVVGTKSSSPLRLRTGDNSTYAESDITSGFSTGTYEGSFSVRFTPTDYDEIDNYTLRFSIKKGSRVLKTIEHPMSGRALPEEFVIAVKRNDQWYALPNTILNNTKAITPLKISVDDATTPTAATYASTATVYKGYETSNSRYAAGTNVYGVRLTDPDNHWLQVSSSSGTNYVWVSESGSATCQDWWLKSSDLSSYTLQVPSSGAGDKSFGINNLGNIGFFASDATNLCKEVYLLPITNKYTDVPATVHEWGEHGVILNASMTNVASATMNVESASPADADLSAVNAASLTAGKYVRVYNEAVTVGDVANEGKQLYVHWKNAGGDEIGISQITIPCVVASSNDMKSIAGTKGAWSSKSEVHVLPGVTLEANPSSFAGDGALSVSQMVVYPGATLKVTSPTFNATTLRLRNGWTRAGDKSYDVARVYIADDAALTKTTASMDYDIYDWGEGKHYYPIAVPFETAVSGIDYLDETLAGASTYGTHYVIKTYDGENRAKKGAVDENWVVVGSDETLKPGVGYIMTGVGIPAYGGCIIRIPLEFNNAWTADGELATAHYDDADHTKNSVTVTAHTGAAATANKCNAGWNMLGVPYMSCYGDAGGGMYGGDAVLLEGKMVINAGKIEFEDDDVKYVSVPTHDFSEYIQVDITDEKTELRPGWSFFVQIGTSGTLTFLTANEQADSDLPIYAPKRTAAEQKVVKTGIVLSSETASDKTTFLISDRYSSEYEIGADLEKMFGNGYTLATYSLNNGARLAFNAMSTAQANELIPIGIRLPEDGEYTFSLNERYADADIERLDLIDYETGEVTDLMATDYIFYATRSQNDERFALNVQRGKQTPTDIGGADIGAPDGARKILLNGTIFIVRDGLLYDATGKRVQTNK